MPIPIKLLWLLLEHFLLSHNLSQVKLINTYLHSVYLNVYTDNTLLVLNLQW